MPSETNEERARLLKLRCPHDYVKLEFDEPSGEWYCPNCSYSEEVIDADLL